MTPRMSFFVNPTSGETVHSVMCRLLTRYPIANCEFVESTGAKTLTYDPLLPAHLERLPRIVPEGHPWTNLARILRDHTAIPYLTAFRDEGERRKFLTADGCGRAPNKAAIGNCSPSVKSFERRPVFCPACVKEDQAQGFSRYQVAHNLPGVKVCHKHGCPLSVGCTECGPYPYQYRRFLLAGRCRDSAHDSPLNLCEKLLGPIKRHHWLAEQSEYLLRVSVPASIEGYDVLENIKSRVDTPKAHLHAIENFWTTDFLESFPNHLSERQLQKYWSRDIRTVDTLDCLLMLAPFYSSVEAAIASVQAATVLRARTESEFGTNVEALDKARRFGLLPAVLRKLGPKKVDLIREELLRGRPKLLIESQFSISHHGIAALCRSDPELHVRWKRAVAEAGTQQIFQPVSISPPTDTMNQPDRIGEIGGQLSPISLRQAQDRLNRFRRALREGCPKHQICSEFAITYAALAEFCGREPELDAAWLRHQNGRCRVSSAKTTLLNGVVAFDNLDPLAEQFAIVREADPAWLRRLDPRAELGKELRASLRRGEQKYHIGKRLGLSHQAVSLMCKLNPRLQEEWELARYPMLDRAKHEVLAALERDPTLTRSTIRARFPREFLLLTEVAVDWIDEHLPKVRGASGRKPFDELAYAQRDKELAERFRVAATELKGRPGRPRRIGQTTILRHLGTLSLYDSNKEFMPRTTAELEVASESVRAFDERLIDWGLQQYVAPRRSVDMHSFLLTTNCQKRLIVENSRYFAKRIKELGLHVKARSSLVKLIHMPIPSDVGH